MTPRRIAVIGGGIVGAAVARRLQQSLGAEVTILEKETTLAFHQTGRNSGVVHAGIYYTPGSLKAHLCRRGVSMLREFCTEHSIAYDEIGKVLVARDVQDAGRLGDIEQRAHANGVPGVRRLNAAQLREIEPHVVGVEALHSPTTAIADFPAVTRKLADQVVAEGGQLLLGHEVTGIERAGDLVRLRVRHDDHTYDETYDHVLICAGLQVDQLARRLGADPYPRVMPFRGEYYLLTPDKRHLVNGLVYPVPDPRYPFLGVHLTPRVDGEVLVGPNAVLALAREGYRWRDVSPRDLLEIVGHPGMPGFARKNWRTGVAEVFGSLSKRRFTERAREYLPELRPGDMLPGPHGIRAQAMDRDGSLVDDFRIDHLDHVTVLRNAPSPAATSCLAIAEYVVDDLMDRK